MDNNETTDLIFKQLDLISDSIYENIKIWKTKVIPTNLIKMVVSKGLIDVDKVDGEKEKVFFGEYNKLLTLLIDQCEKDASEMGVTHIPIELFDSHIDIVKSAFMAAAKG